MQDRSSIEARIPHRAPFLLVDRLVDETDATLEAEWDVPADADWFRGHYPGEPVLPGVLLSEHVFQAAACLISARLSGFAAGDGVPVLTKIESARFKRIVRPGETVRTRVSVRDTLGPAWYMDGQVTCGGATALKIRFVLSATAALGRAAGE